MFRDGIPATNANVPCDRVRYVPCDKRHRANVMWQWPMSPRVPMCRVAGTIPGYAPRAVWRVCAVCGHHTRVCAACRVAGMCRVTGITRGRPTAWHIPGYAVAGIKRGRPNPRVWIPPVWAEAGLGYMPRSGAAFCQSGLTAGPVWARGYHRAPSNGPV